MMGTWFKKFIFLFLLAAFIFFVGGFGGILLDRYLIPKLASVPLLAQWGIFKELTERVTIINKTEQIVIREDDTVERIVSQPATAVVNVVTLAEKNTVAPQTVTTTTGVLLTNDGLVATYSQQPFEQGENRYSILLFDGSSYRAEFIGYDSLVNLAFFRLSDPVPTPSIAFANSDDARVGKKIIAIGNAAGENQTRLSVGILGNINRTLNLSGKTVSSSEKWEGVFEMDLVGAENFRGGPVIGFNGEMVGLVGTILVDNVSSVFLLPANVVRASLDRVIRQTLAQRPTLGVYYIPITKAFALGQGLARDRGALIFSPSGKRGLALLADSPAWRAGLQVGDIISAIDGREINLDNPLPKALSSYAIGDQIVLTVIRDKKEISVPLNL